jgi:hypothetical protein
MTFRFDTHKLYVRGVGLSAQHRLQEVIAHKLGIAPIPCKISFAGYTVVAYEIVQDVLSHVLLRVSENNLLLVEFYKVVRYPLKQQPYAATLVSEPLVSNYKISSLAKHKAVVIEIRPKNT